MYSMTRRVCGSSTSAPSRVAGSSGSPGAMDFATATISSSSASRMPSCTSSREPAEHISPWLKKIAPAAARAARLRSG